MSAGCPGIAWDCLGTGYLIRWFTFGISRLAEVVTPQVTRRGRIVPLRYRGRPLRGVIARFQVVGYPFGNLPQTFRPCGSGYRTARAGRVAEDFSGFLNHVEADKSTDDIVRIGGGKPPHQKSCQDHSNVCYHVGAREQPRSA